MTHTDDGFPIRELVRRTGVNASTLRAWETRHQLLRPLRTDSGHRLYNQEDVSRVLLLKELLAEGHSLADSVPLLDHPATPAGHEFEYPTSWPGFIARLVDAIEQFSTEGLDLVYGEACALNPLTAVNRHLLIPVFELLGNRWQQRESGIAEEHFFSAWVRNKLGAWLHHNQVQPRGGRLVCACLPGEHHETGLLMFALEALSRNYRVIYLGADMPLRQILPVAKHTRAKAVVLAGRNTWTPSQSLADIAWLTRQVTVPVLVGGHFSKALENELIQVGAIPLGDNMLIGLSRLESRAPA